MGQDFFTYLPSEMIMNILSRLPIRSIIQCKSVCKSWLDLLATPEFVKSHLSRSAACLAVSFNGNHTNPYKFFEFVHKLNLDHPVPYWNMVTLFDSNLPCAEPPHSSANGLLFLCSRGVRYFDLYQLQLDSVIQPRNLFICNPITRDYIIVPCPQEASFSKDQLQRDAYGFGVSRMSGQYKLVRMFHQRIQGTHVPMKYECQVYTVGTGSWRRIGSGGRPLLYTGDDVGLFLNGNLHWLALERESSSVWISCFDLETELFSTFSPPPDHLHGTHTRSWALYALGECLCLCDNSAEEEMIIWSMKELGDDKSWIKEFIFPKKSHVYHYIGPIKVFENGDILMVMEACAMIYYFTSKAKPIRNLRVPGLSGDFSIRAIMYTPSFVPLRTFAMENVASF